MTAVLRVVSDYIVMSAAEGSHSNGFWTCHDDLPEAYRCARKVGGMIYRRTIARNGDAVAVHLNSVAADTLHAFQEAFDDLPETGVVQP